MDKIFAANCFEQIKGFGSYGFLRKQCRQPFALWLQFGLVKKNHPADSRGAAQCTAHGLYAPAEIVRSAPGKMAKLPLCRRCRVRDWDQPWTNPLTGLALRLGLLVYARSDGFREDAALP